MNVKRFPLAFGCALQLILASACERTYAQSIVRIEEDWVLQVVAPDEHLDAPQVTTAMMPFGPNSSIVAYLDINHGSEPDYSAGGLQLRIDQAGSNTDSKRLLSGQKLNQNTESIRWTQVTIQQGSLLKFGVIAGQSQSWSHFGGGDTFIDVVIGGESLNSYRPADSLSNSGAVYAGNRVASLSLLRIRLFNSLGQMIEVPINQSPL